MEVKQEDVHDEMKGKMIMNPSHRLCFAASLEQEQTEFFFLVGLTSFCSSISN